MRNQKREIIKNYFQTRNQKDLLVKIKALFHKKIDLRNNQMRINRKYYKI
jgi:hypothetical protein